MSRVATLVLSGILWGPLSMSVVACAPDLTLAVSVHSDLGPGTDFHSVVAEIGTFPFELGRTAVRVPAATTDDFVAGKAVQPFRGLDCGSYALTVSLRDAADTVVVERLLYFELEGDAALAIELTQSCARSTCPFGETCIDGTCTDPACSPFAPEACP